MKKGLKFGLVIAMALAMVMAFTACGSGNSSSGSSNKKYIIATDTTFAPFEFEDKNGKRVGIDMDLLKAVAKDQHFDYTVKALGFNAAVQSLESDQSDAVIAGMSITSERKKKFDFSAPYFDSGVGMAVKANNTAIKDYSDLKGKTVAVKTGTEGATFANENKAKYGYSIKTFEDSANMYEDVKSGNSAACFEDYPVLGYAIAKGQPLKLVGKLQAGNSYGFAVHKSKNAELLKKFNKGLKNLKDSGEYDKIVNKYVKKK
ncbi:transporter substrate-binding domain-containing protein [Pseudoramibacter alactolyticus]